MPLKDKKITKKSLENLGLKGVIETQPIATHDINVVAVALTASIHL